MNDTPDKQDNCDNIPKLLAQKSSKTLSLKNSANATKPNSINRIQQVSFLCLALIWLNLVLSHYNHQPPALSKVAATLELKSNFKDLSEHKQLLFEAINQLNSKAQHFGANELSVFQASIDSYNATLRTLKAEYGFLDAAQFKSDNNGLWWIESESINQVRSNNSR
jgi:hypothetical protein